MDVCSLKSSKEKEGSIRKGKEEERREGGEKVKIWEDEQYNYMRSEGKKMEGVNDRREVMEKKRT